MDKSFGELLQSYLNKYGFTEADLARELEAAPSTINRWINDETTPRRQSIDNIAVVLNLEVEELDALLRKANYEDTTKIRRIIAPKGKKTFGESEESDRVVEPGEESTDRVPVAAPLAFAPEASTQDEQQESVASRTDIEAATKDNHNQLLPNNQAVYLAPTSLPESTATDLTQLKQQRPPRLKWAVWGVAIPVLITVAIWLGYDLFRPSVTPSVAEQTTVSTAAIKSEHTPTATLTATPVSVIASLLTPTPIPIANPDETLILIATFHGKAANEHEPHIKIRREIEEKIKSLGESNVRVALDATVLNADQRTEAEALGKWYSASMVIWGEDTGIELVVNYLNLREPDFDAAAIKINTTEQRIQLANPDVYAQFVTRDLPNQLSFLSLFAVGQSYYLNQDYPHAITVIEEATTSLNSGNELKLEGLVDAYFRLGWLYQFSTPNDLDQAIINYNKVIVISPDDSNAYLNRGVVYYHQNNLKAAFDDYNKAIQLNPNLIEAYINRGAVHHIQGKLDKAIADYDKAITLNPNYTEAYFNRGLALEDLGKLTDAIIDYNQAINLTPNLAQAYLKRGMTFKTLEKLNEAIDDYNKAIELNPNYAEAYMSRGIAYANKSQYDKAFTDYDKAIKLNANLVEAYFNRGIAFKALGKLNEAVNDYSKAIELKPNFAEAYINRGTAYVNQDQYDTAIANFDQAIKLQPDNAKAYYNRGLVHHYQSNPFDLVHLASALTNYNKAIELKPDYVAAYVSRGLAFKTLGKPYKAINDYNKAIELNPNYAEAYLKRAALYQDEGKLSESLSDLYRYLELEPDTQHRVEVEQEIAKIEAELAKQKQP